MKQIQLKGITKKYKGLVAQTALDEVDLEVEKGELVAIVGPSGAGKSTLLHILGCVDKPTSGSYKLEGQEMTTLNNNELSSIRGKKIGFVFQDFALVKDLNAVENVELPLQYQHIGLREARRRALDALDRVGLKEYARRFPSELSGGQQQRVAIARALVSNPVLILADEPTGSLDSKTGEDILNRLKEVNDAGHTVIIVTHNHSIADSCRRIVEIKDGKIVSDTARDSAV